MSKKPGKAHKRVKAQRAAKHRARQHKERARRRTGASIPPPFPLAAPPTPPALASAGADAAFEFCKKHDLHPHKVFLALTESQTGPWAITAGTEKHEVDEAVRRELIARLSRVMVSFKKWNEAQSAPKVATVQDEPKDCL